MTEREHDLIQLIYTTALEVKQHPQRYRFMKKMTFAETVLQRVINLLVPGITKQERDDLVFTFRKWGELK